jgi:hypothetical protein
MKFDKSSFEAFLQDAIKTAQELKAFEEKTPGLAWDYKALGTTLGRVSSGELRCSFRVGSVEYPASPNGYANGTDMSLRNYVVFITGDDPDNGYILGECETYDDAMVASTWLHERLKEWFDVEEGATAREAEAKRDLRRGNSFECDGTGTVN